MPDFVHSFEDGVLRIDGAEERTDEYVGDNSSADCGDIVIGGGGTEGRNSNGFGLDWGGLGRNGDWEETSDKPERKI